MSDFLYSFIRFRVHYSFQRDIFIPSVFAFIYSDANKHTTSLSFLLVLPKRSMMGSYLRVLPDFLTHHSFSVTLFTIVLRLFLFCSPFFILLQINYSMLGIYCRVLYSSQFQCDIFYPRLSPFLFYYNKIIILFFVYRHPHICILFSSRFTSYNKQQHFVEMV